MNSLFIQILPLLVLPTVIVGEVSKEYIQSNNGLAIDLQGKLIEGNADNTMFSTFCLQNTLALLSVVSDKETAQEIKKAAHLFQSDEDIKIRFNHLHRLIEEIPEKVSVSNLIYFGKQININSDFIKLAQDTFHIGVQKADFSNVSVAAGHINSLVQQKVYHKMKNTVDARQFDDQTKMVLVNAIHFKASWKSPFTLQQRVKSYFHVNQNEKVEIKAIETTADILYHRSDLYRCHIFRLEHEGTDGKTVLAFVLPDDIEGVHDVQRDMKQIVSGQNFERKYMRLRIPRFKFEESINLKSALQKLGILRLFNNPDLSAIANETLKVDVVAQTIIFEVNGKAPHVPTEADTSTTKILPKSNEEIVEYNLDRPFVYCLLYDEVALLTGRIMNPLEKRNVIL